MRGATLPTLPPEAVKRAVPKGRRVGELALPLAIEWAVIKKLTLVVWVLESWQADQLTQLPLRPRTMALSWLVPTSTPSMNAGVQERVCPVYAKLQDLHDTGKQGGI